MIEARAHHDAWVPAVAAAALAGFGGAALQAVAVLDRLPESAEALIWVLAWTSILWSALAAVAAISVLWRERRVTGASIAPSAAVVSLALAAVLVAVLLHPPFGSGGGTG